MKFLISTSILTLVAISATAGVMPEEIPSAATAITEAVEVASASETTAVQPQQTFKEQIDDILITLPPPSVINAISTSPIHLMQMLNH